VRHGDWKLVWDKHAKSWELYDLAADRTEAHNLAAEHPDLVSSLSQSWEAWAETTGVTR
jgi:arylsulfatase A-like enzyme